MRWRCPLEFREATLSNGLEIVAECNPRAYSVGVAYFVNTGSRDETDDIAGVSHFLEHMVFKGTPQRTADDVNRELDEIGSHSNAYTSEERTVYYSNLLPELQERAVDLLSDLMRPSLRENDFNTEKQVIIEEIYKYEDQPPFGAHEKCMNAHFGSHPLGRSILGTVESVTGLTSDAMRSYFERRYSPGNMTLVAAGRVEFEQLVAQAEHLCGGWQSFETHREAPSLAPRNGREIFVKDSAVQQYVVLMSRGPAATDNDRYAARVLGAVLGDDSGSRLYWDLVETGLAEYAVLASHEFQGAGIFMAFLCCTPEQTVENLDRIQGILSAAEQEGITESELMQAKNKIAAQVVLASERASNRLFAVGSGWTQRREYRTVKETVDAYQAVTLDDVRAVLDNYQLTQNTMVAVGPLTDLPDLAG